MKISIANFGFLLFVFSTSVFCQVKWKEWVAPDSSFRISAPGPMKKVAHFDGEHGALLEKDQAFGHSSSYAVFDADPEECRFGITIVDKNDIPASMSKSKDFDEYLAVLMIGNEDEAQLMSPSRPITQNGIKGREYLYIEKGDLYTRGRVFETRTSIYFVVFIGKDERDLNSVDAERFLNSFHLIKQ